jgi:phosphate transport system permease protein
MPLPGMASSMLQYTLLGLAIVALIAFFAGLSKARAVARANPGVKLHSQLGYYGYYTAIWAVLPAALAIALWSATSPFVIKQILAANLPAEIQALDSGQQALALGRISSVAEGVARMTSEDLKTIEGARLGFSTLQSAADTLRKYGVPLGSAPEKFVISGAYEKVLYEGWSRWLRSGLAAILAVLGFIYAYSRIRPRLRARNSVEAVMLGTLIAASTIAILTTVGIVFSVLFESIRFFNMVDPSNFYLGTVWDPRFTSADDNRGQGQFGFIPLSGARSTSRSDRAAGGRADRAVFRDLHVGIRLETVRGFAKPALEILAGIPTDRLRLLRADYRRSVPPRFRLSDRARNRRHRRC